MPTKRQALGCFGEICPFGNGKTDNLLFKQRIGQLEALVFIGSGIEEH
jgi:hypothetical protein